MEFEKNETTNFEAESMVFDTGEQVFIKSKEEMEESSVSVAEEGVKASNPYLYAAGKAISLGKNTFELLSGNYKRSVEHKKAQKNNSGVGGLLYVAGLAIVVIILISSALPIGALAYMLQAPVGCFICRGTGITTHPSYAASCEVCHGEGSVVIFDGDGGGDYWLTVMEGCRQCGGGGRIEIYRGPDDYEEEDSYVAGSGAYGTCRFCNGAGET